MRTALCIAIVLFLDAAFPEYSIGTIISIIYGIAGSLCLYQDLKELIQ